MIYLILGILYESFLHPVTILSGLPTAGLGALLTLLAFGMELDMYGFVGLVMLIGIVTKNAIMLVDFAVEEVRAGVSPVEAIIDAGRKRARPIIMTTLAMAAGMLPSALGVGEGGEFRAPMAIGVIGGLLLSTVLSLIFVPSFYLLMDGASRRTSSFFRRFLNEAEPDPVAALAEPQATVRLQPVQATAGRDAA